MRGIWGLFGGIFGCFLVKMTLIWHNQGHIRVILGKNEDSCVLLGPYFAAQVANKFFFFNKQIHQQVVLLFYFNMKLQNKLLTCHFSLLNLAAQQSRPSCFTVQCSFLLLIFLYCVGLTASCTALRAGLACVLSFPSSLFFVLMCFAHGTPLRGGVFTLVVLKNNS